jgi:Holliday junction DNA helicase RuvA
MIAKLSGIVDDILEDSIIVDIKGIGYQVYITSRFLSSLNIGDSVVLRTMQIFKQEQQSLFGFQSSNELNLFKNLLRVHGIGARSAISVLSLLTPEELAIAIATQDPDILLRVSGIGEKTASRILLELKDIITQSGDYEPSYSGEISDAILGLISLGYQRGEVLKIVNKVTSSISSTSSANEIIVASLRELK